MRIYSPKREERERERVERNVDEDNKEDSLIRGDSCMMDESVTLLFSIESNYLHDQRYARVSFASLASC